MRRGGVDLRFNAEMESYEPGWTVKLKDGRTERGDQLLLASGAWPRAIATPSKGRC